jgi:hypothetical protein
MLNIDKYKKRFTPEKIEKLNPNQIFVFGSNEKGIHGKGAALQAKKVFGAVQGCGFGLTGNSFAIPTKIDPYHILDFRKAQYERIQKRDGRNILFMCNFWYSR